MKTSIIVLLAFVSAPRGECRVQRRGPYKVCPLPLSLMALERCDEVFLFQTFFRHAWARLPLRRLLHEGGSEVYENLPLLLLLRQVLLHLLPQRPHPCTPGEGRWAVGLQGTINIMSLIEEVCTYNKTYTGFIIGWEKDFCWLEIKRKEGDQLDFTVQDGERGTSPAAWRQSHMSFHAVLSCSCFQLPLIWGTPTPIVPTLLIGTCWKNTSRPNQIFSFFPYPYAL